MNQEEHNGDQKDVLGEYKNDEEDNDEEEEEKLFPFKIVGDGTKKGGAFGKYNSRYFEIDSIKGLFKRYTSSKEYPKNPKEVIEIKNFTKIEKKKIAKEFNDIEITYIVTNSKGKKSEKKDSYRFRHLTCRNTWFDYLLTLWKCYASNTPPPKFTKQILSFIDDRLGIIQEIGRGRKTKREGGKKKFKMDLNKFKVLSLLGIGGFGTVFKVRHIMTGKIYAMKVMNKNYIIQKKYLHYVVSEFKIMKLISGFPFVLDLHYCFQSSNYLYLIIDYCPNGDFTNLESMNNLKLFFAEVVLAFEYIHNKGVIYRDLKPENILLDQTGHVKLCDFNLAKAGMTKTKRAFSFCGSPLYFSPEMVMNKGVTYKCDVYGIGVLMYEMVTGKMAFEANYIKELYEKIKKNDIDYNHPKLTGDIKDLIMKMCAKDENDRIDLEEVKKHKYFSDIDFNKVLNKEYGRIETFKKDKKSQPKVYDDNIIKMKEREDLERKKFLEQQRFLEEDTTLTVLKGKITLKEMMLDQTRHMKNRVRDFYYVKDEDIDQTGEFQLEIKGNNDISPLIMDKYNEQEGK
jgi:serine/threonine protein kinase